MLKGSYIYYGYKLKEKVMLDKLINNEDSEWNFLNHLRTLDLSEYCDEEIDLNNKLSKSDVSTLTSFIKDYFSDTYFGRDGEKSKIQVNCNSCCAYNSVSDWVVGIELCFIPAFKDDITKLEMYKPTKDEIRRLKEIRNEYDLPDNLDYYTLSSDCWSCT